MHVTSFNYIDSLDADVPQSDHDQFVEVHNAFYTKVKLLQLFWNVKMKINK
jgi:hypothetical protein